MFKQFQSAIPRKQWYGKLPLEMPIGGMMKKKSKMFLTVSQTWNPYHGCLHGCTYCWARKQAVRLRSFNKRYKDGFAPAFFQDLLLQRFKPGSLVFVSSMGDLFGDWVEWEVITSILRTIEKSPKTDFLLCTKNPIRYHEFPFTPNVILGVTIESDIDYGVTKAPLPEQRFTAMEAHPHPRKFVSIEPVMNFNLGKMLYWVRAIKPEIVEIGADTLKNDLIEPDTEKLAALIIGVEAEVKTVSIKPSLYRLLPDYWE